MKEQCDKIRINLIGAGCSIQKSKINDVLLNRMFLVASKLRTTLSQALLDVDFFSLLDIAELKSISDFDNEFEFAGLLLDNPLSRLEIWKNGKRKKIIKFGELYNEGLLFPLYDIDVVKVDARIKNSFEIVFIENSMGTVLDLSVPIHNFSMDKLLFKICEVENSSHQKIVFDILYDGKTIFVRLPETLVTSLNVFLK